MPVRRLPRPTTPARPAPDAAAVPDATAPDTAVPDAAVPDAAAPDACVREPAPVAAFDARDAVAAWAPAGPVYAPPYATPLADAFAWHLVKYLAPGLRLHADVAGPALGTLTTRLDFVVERRTPRGRRRVGFVWTPPADAPADARLHDAAAVGLDAVDVLYRLRPADVAHRLDDVLFLAAQWDDACFSERGRTNLRTLASPTARVCDPAAAVTTFRLDYAGAPDTADDLLGTGARPPATLVVRRLSRRHPAGWHPAYEHARATHGHPARRPAA
jgi:hypothetical protein